MKRDNDEKLTKITLSAQDLDTLICAMSMYSIRSAYEEKRPILEDHKELKAYLVRKAFLIDTVNTMRKYNG